MISFPSSSDARASRTSGLLRRTVRAAAMSAAAALVAIGAVATTGGEDAAALERLPTNAMAPFVQNAAQQALDGHDAYLATDDAASYRKFVWYRAQTAAFAATELGVPEQEMIDAWGATSESHQRAVLAAMTQVGVPYRYNTSKPGVGFDCSGLTTFAWKKGGAELVRQSTAQIRNAEQIERDSAKAGDLVQYPGHVMMYLGVGDTIIHSVQTGRTVELDTISERRRTTARFGDPIA